MRIAQLRRNQGMTQQAFADALGVSRGAVANWERGQGIKMDNLTLIAERFGVPLDWLANGAGEAPTPAPPSDATARGRLQPFKPTIVPGHELVGARDFPIYGSAQGGAGSLIITTDPVEYVKRPSILEGVPNAYGMLVTGDLMEPVYEQGDMLLIHPGAPPRRKNDVVLYDHPPGGESEAIVKRLMGWDDNVWRLKQFNPEKEWTEFRVDWPTCHLVVGCYKRRG